MSNAWKCDMCGQFSSNYEDKSTIAFTDRQTLVVTRFDVCDRCYSKTLSLFKVANMWERRDD